MLHCRAILSPFIQNVPSWSQCSLIVGLTRLWLSIPPQRALFCIVIFFVICNHARLFDGAGRVVVLNDAEYGIDVTRFKMVLFGFFFFCLVNDTLYYDVEPF